MDTEKTCLILQVTNMIIFRNIKQNNGEDSNDFR